MDVINNYESPIVFFATSREGPIGDFYFTCLFILFVFIALLLAIRFFHEKRSLAYALKVSSMICIVLLVFAYQNISNRFIQGQLFNTHMQLTYANLFTASNEVTFNIAEIEQVRFRPSGRGNTPCSVIIYLKNSQRHQSKGIDKKTQVCKDVRLLLIEQID